jgi:uncharacterized protein (DUF302 family)
MIYKVRSTSLLDEIERRLQESAARQQFGVIAVHDLQEMLNKKGVDLAIECRIYEVCNPLQARKVLEADGAISTALPCRISVYGAPRDYTLATMRPTRYSDKAEEAKGGIRATFLLNFSDELPYAISGSSGGVDCVPPTKRDAAEMCSPLRPIFQDAHHPGVVAERSFP